jgi:hypothetical protein
MNGTDREAARYYIGDCIQITNPMHGLISRPVTDRDRVGTVTKITRKYQKSLDFRLDSGSSWLDGVNGILMQQEPILPKQDDWNQRAIASLANTLITVVEPVPMPLLSSMLLLQL